MHSSILCIGVEFSRSRSASFGHELPFVGDVSQAFEYSGTFNNSLIRAKVEIGLNLTYNMKRVGQLLKRDVKRCLRPDGGSVAA